MKGKLTGERSGSNSKDVFVNNTRVRRSRSARQPSRMQCVPGVNVFDNIKLALER